MLWLPSLAPGLFPCNLASGPGGAGTRELWVLVMGAVNTSLGAGALGGQAIRQAWRISLRLAPLATSQAAAISRPAALPQPSRV